MANVLASRWKKSASFLDLYDRGDQQKMQLKRTYDVALGHLDGLKRQRAELDDAIDDLTDQLKWVDDKIATLDDE